MNKDEKHEKFYSYVESAQKIYKEISEKASFSLILACWVLLNLSIGESSPLSINHLGKQLMYYSILCSVLFLFMMGIRGYLNMRHFEKVFDTSQKLSHDEFDRKKSCYGNISHLLTYIDDLILLISFILFAYGACLVSLH